MCKERGDLHGLFVLAHSLATLRYVKYSSGFDDPLYFELYLQVRHYATIAAEREQIEKALLADAIKLGQVVNTHGVDVVQITPKLQADKNWRIGKVAGATRVKRADLERYKDKNTVGAIR
jgi:hypothetical protein